MKRSKRSKRRNRTYESDAKAASAASNQNADAGPVGRVPDFVFLRNAHDQLATDKLRSTPVGGLAVDHLIRSNPKMVMQLREALVEVYFKAANRREHSRASKHQVSGATGALKRLNQAVELLERASSDGRTGLQMQIEGTRLDDEKGEKEVNQFASACGSVKIEIVHSILKLQSIITGETQKTVNSGERRKRLRTLVDTLASWWLSNGGKSLASYVRANRRDGDRAVVHGRSGKFLSLAVALLCGVDVFKNSEVEAAVTNVHEARLATKSLHAATAF
jgi:hypothetical protein